MVVALLIGGLNASGTSRISSLVADTADINGGSIDGTAIGADSATTGKFTDLTSSNLTSGRVVLAGTSGILTDDGEITYNSTTNTLSTINLTLSGSLKVNGSTTYVNVSAVTITDPIIALGTASDGADPSSDDNLDRGIVFKMYEGSVKNRFIGYDNSETKFVLYDDVTITNEVIQSGGTLGTFLLGTLNANSAVNASAINASGFAVSSARCCNYTSR